MLLDDIRFAVSGPLPFSFVYGGDPAEAVLSGWAMEHEERRSDGRLSSTTTWTDPASGLRVRCHSAHFSEFPALEWMLEFENTGSADTPIIEDVLPLDLQLDAPLDGPAPYWLHRTNGAPSDETDYEPSRLPVWHWQPRRFGPGDGRSSNGCLPFFKVETRAGSVVIAIGWSGQWSAAFEASDEGVLHMAAGMQRTHFRLHPGEHVRTPRILLLEWQGDTVDANNQFRRLIYRHYAARRGDAEPLPVLFSNTCFTRAGAWLNECNADNQISLIDAYAPLGLEAVITDAGWFEGGWPLGAGNWTPRRDAYPEGIAPVARAALDRAMAYGLWFEPERVVAGTSLHMEHPDWVLTDGQDGQRTLLANFGLPEVRDHFLRIVGGFMDLPGFRVYRQDFNLSPLAYWRHTDAPDRQGISEMRYIAGLYDYWDRIIAAWPDSLREECASGGRRIDLETVMRFHIHQDSDYWFQDDTDQCQVWGLSQYLPNSLFTTPISRLDDYTFRSVVATSVCVGWIADSPDFDHARAAELLERYRALRHLIVGDWYPLLPYSRLATDWMAMQWHRPDLGAGIVLVFRRAESPYPIAELALRGLETGATYELASERTGVATRATGDVLLRAFTVEMPERRSSDMIIYRRLDL